MLITNKTSNHEPECGQGIPLAALLNLTTFVLVHPPLLPSPCSGIPVARTQPPSSSLLSQFSCSNHNSWLILTCCSSGSKAGKAAAMLEYSGSTIALKNCHKAIRGGRGSAMYNETEACITTKTHPRLASRDARLVPIHERRHRVAPRLLLVPLPEHLLLQQAHPLQVHALRTGEVAQVGTLQGHLVWEAGARTEVGAGQEQRKVS